MIPESVYQITSCSTRKKKRFDTPIASFRFRFFFPVFFFGHAVAQQPHGILLATPEKAVLDYLYFRTEFDADDFYEWRLNIELNEDDFTRLSHFIRKELELEGYSVEMKQVLKGAYHCYIRFPDILYAQKLSPATHEKILIQLDTEPQIYPDCPGRNAVKLENRCSFRTQTR